MIIMTFNKFSIFYDSGCNFLLKKIMMFAVII